MNAGRLLTPRQAYLAMFEFLRRHYERDETDVIGGLLGGLSLLPDGGSADPTQLVGWEQAVQAVMTAESQPGGYRGADFALQPPSS
ncbi:hypothetical protein J0H58_13555 [bacterium]|nr:hypothetical protein [bacterium]